MPRYKPSAQIMKIRLRLKGCANRPFYEIVVVPDSKPRDYIPTELLGSYDPLPNIHNEKLVAFNFERLEHWLGKGAEVTQPIEKLLGLAGYFPVHPNSHLDAYRNRIKQAEELKRIAEEEKAALAEEASALAAETAKQTTEQTTEETSPKT